MQIRRKGNIKKKVGLLGVFLVFFSLIFISAPPAYAGTITEYTVDSGQFNTWLHSDGVTWQNIPGYGRVKPLDTVTFTYVVPYDGNNLSKVKGVKAVYFYNGDKTIYEKSPRASWQSYDNYSKGNYHWYSVKNLTVNSFTYLGNGRVQITITTKLDTHTIDGAFPGEHMHEPFQGEKTQGRKFYTPTVIEWEIEGEKAGSDFFITPEGSTKWQESYKTSAKTYHGRPGDKINIPVTLRLEGSANSTTIEGSWWGAGWSNPIVPRQTVSLGQNGYRNFNFSVTVPQQGQETKLVFVCNRDGNSPANEVNKNNNMTVITITPNGTGTPGSGETGKQEYLTVVPSRYTLFEGDYNRFKAYHHKADGSTPEVTNGAEWSVSNNNIARLSTTTKGELWGVKEGQVLLTAKYKGMEGTSNVTVIPEPVPPPPNFKPKADFDISNSSPIEGEQVHFYDSSTHEGNRYGEEIVSWEWTFEEIGSSYEQNPEATWNEVGTYKVRLRVEDQDGDSDSCSKSVVVGPALPAAVITTSTNHLIIGREIHIDGDESTAAMNRDIKWDEMEWKFYNPSNTLAYEYTGRYPLGKGTSGEKDLTNSVLNKTGNWRITLKVKDTNDNESEITEKIIQILPDNPPIADFWLAEEGIRNSYEGYEITVRDLSTPDNPDGSLGDEIYERTWTLYYDTNNDGNAKGSGDEIIHPGDKNKAAQIIQTSNNDPRPVIRFNKTGRYQLELKVKERYDAWGETIEGLTADTEDKALEEKQIMVINLAPTVAFDIKKKTPVDILFATDYTVSDTKYGSLESSQAGFINELESGFIEPEVEVVKVNKGDTALSLDVAAPYNSSFLNRGPYYNHMTPTVDPNWYNIGFGGDRMYGKQCLPSRINIHTGQVLSGFFPVPTVDSYIFIGAFWSPGWDDPEDIVNITGKTKNNKFTINAKRGLLQVLNNSGQIVASQEILTSNAKKLKGSRTVNPDRPLMIAPWADNKTVVIYQNALYEKRSGSSITKIDDYIYLFLLNNETGQILANYEFTGFYANGDRDRSDLGLLGIGIKKLGTELVGIQTTTCINDREDYTYKIHIIDKNFNHQELDSITDGNRSWNQNNDVMIHPISDNAVLAVRYEGTDVNNDTFKIIKSYGSYWFPSLYLKSTSWRTEWTASSAHYNEYLPYFAVFEDGSFINTHYDDTKSKFITQYYNDSAQLMWQIKTDQDIHVPRNEIIDSGGLQYLREYQIGRAKKFMDYIVLTDAFDGEGTVTHLVNPNNGQIVQTFPYKWLGHDEKFLLLQSGMDLNTVLKGYGQLQGLQYLKQAIENHNWETNKFNVVVSVIDGDSFADYEAQKASIKSLLQANNLKLAVISPSTGKTKTQAEQLIAQNPDGGWWIPTASNMSAPLSDLAKKIIQAVNEDRGADNIVLVGQEAELKANYNDMEKDPADIMEWYFNHDNENLGSSLQLVNKAGISTLHNTKQTVLLDSNNQNQLDITFDQAGTYKVYCKARDYPVTTSDYLEDEKAGKKWSNQDAYITVIAHHKPIANFTINSSSIHKNAPLSITDNSYDPDLYNVITKATTDPLNQKGIRAWEWQYKKPDGTWEKHLTNDNIPPTIYANAGTYQIRLRVQDVFGAWSDWTDSKTFNVINRPPIANFTVDPNPASVGNRSMIIDSSYDLDGDDEIVEWKWEIEKGLGETETIIRTSSAPFPYIWNMEGVFNVKLTVKDIEGATGSITKPVTVLLNHPPVAVIKLPAEIFTDEWFTADGTSSYDPDGDIITKAYWQYMKPGDTNWSATYTQVRGGSFTIPKESFLKYPIYPQDVEHGVWKLRLIVEDDKGLASLPAEVTFNILEGWEITGSILPEVGERGRYMRVMAYAHRKNKPNEKYTIDSMKAELVYLDEALTKSGRAATESIETLNMPYDSSKADFRQDYLVGEKVYDTNRWPADGRYYVKVIGQKGSTQKHIAIPYSIKGNIHQRLYIRTISW